MKKYIKPNTDVTTVMFEGNLLAGTNQNLQFKGESYSNTGGITLGGKEEETISSTSVWDEEE